MSLPRRLQLLEWARQSGALIFEDDYDSELSLLRASATGRGRGIQLIYFYTFPRSRGCAHVD
jgi:GntR family transcriptional regulator/MocR family aminotransferase